MKKIPLKFTLIKEGYSFEHIFKETYKDQIKEKDNFKFFYDERDFPIKNDFASKIIDEAKENLKGARPCLIICYKIELNGKNRNLLIVHGDVRSIIDIWKLEDNFGIKIGINYQIESNQETKFKNIDSKNMLSGDHNRETKAVSANIYNFNFDWLSSFLKQVTLKTKIEEKIMTIKLNNYFQRPFSLDKNWKIENIFQKIEKFIRKYGNLKHYEEKFNFIDNLSLLKDEELINKIKQKIWLEIQENPLNDDFVINWPEFEENNHSYYQVENDNEKLFDLNFQTIIKIAKKQKRKKIENVLLHSCSENFKIDSQKISKCLLGEIKYKNNLYLLNEGKIIKIEEKFYYKTKNEYSKFPTAKINFPSWNSKFNEKDYNQEITNKKDDWHILDRKLLQIKNYQKLEIADVLIADKQRKAFVAIKKLKNSAAISHLVQQTTNAIRLIRWSKKEVEEFIKKESKIKGNIDLNEFKTFIIAIATEKAEKDNDSLPKLPLFSILSIIHLRETVREKDIQIARIPLIT